MDLMKLTAVQLSAKMKAGEIRVTDAVSAALAAIKERDKEVNAFITVDEEGAMKRAGEVQRLIDAGELSGPLAGVPIAVKDNICTKGLKTTCASKILYNFVPTYDAEAAANLEKAGLVIIGKTNMDEFAMGSTTETSYFGVTRNPWNADHVPGGSSGGNIILLNGLVDDIQLGRFCLELLDVFRGNVVIRFNILADDPFTQS